MESQHTVKIVGRGAYGVVYLCLDKDGRNYITKHIPVSDMSPTERQSAMNEVSGISLLLSPLLLHHHRKQKQHRIENVQSFKFLKFKPLTKFRSKYFQCCPIPT